MAALDATWWYYLSKFLDMLDSIFFLLHKKFGHLSTLHVVHHSIMPITSWIGMVAHTHMISSSDKTHCMFIFCEKFYSFWPE